MAEEEEPGEGTQLVEKNNGNDGAEQGLETGRTTSDAATIKPQSIEAKYITGLVVLGLGPAYASIAVIIITNLALNLSETCEKQPLDLLARGSVGFAYAYLFSYGCLLCGPIPYRGTILYLQVYWWFFILVTLVWNTIGYIWLSKGWACLDVAPLLYRGCEFAVYLYFMVILMFVLRFVKIRVGRRLRKSAVRSETKWEKMEQEAMAKIAAEEEEGEGDDDDDDEDQDDDENVDEEDEEEEEEAN